MGFGGGRRFDFSMLTVSPSPSWDGGCESCFFSTMNPKKLYLFWNIHICFRMTFWWGHQVISFFKNLGWLRCDMGWQSPLIPRRCPEPGQRLPVIPNGNDPSEHQFRSHVHMLNYSYLFNLFNLFISIYPSLWHFGMAISCWDDRDPTSWCQTTRWVARTLNHPCHVSLVVWTIISSLPIGSMVLPYMVTFTIHIPQSC